jgi:GT2 family glycosyltransferase
MGEPVVAGIVVHHRSYDTVATTVRAVLASGLPASRLLLVDNSEDPDPRPQLEASVGDVEVLYTENRGYGAAVNTGLEHLVDTLGRIDFLLVATHEVQPEATAVRPLLEALVRDPGAAAAGPTLLIGTGAEARIWSCGGTRSRVLHAHAHVVPDLPVEAVRQLEPADRLWLDGAFVLYRVQALPEPPFDERYFMYMEETDLHYRLRAAGWSCVWIPSAVVAQATNLTPAYWFARNLKLFFRKNEDPLRAAFVPFILVLRDLRSRLRARDRRGARDAVRGLQSPYPGVHARPGTP